MMFGSLVKVSKKVSKIRQKSWFSGNGRALRDVTTIRIENQKSNPFPLTSCAKSIQAPVLM